MSRQMKVALNLLTIQNDPANAREGDIYYNVITKNFYIELNGKTINFHVVFSVTKFGDFWTLGNFSKP